MEDRMSALAQEATIPAFPLGQPVDGRPRYGMTHEMARTYAWLVKNRPHDAMFYLNFRDVAVGSGTDLSTVHMHLRGLLERGWLHKFDNANHMHIAYAFVHPVMTFRGPRHAA